MDHSRSTHDHDTIRNTQPTIATGDWAATAALLGIGELTLRDIVEALIRPGPRSPR